MFDLINGLPLHPLVVHGVVVLLPLAVLGTILIAVRPSWRRTYGPLVVAAAAAATALIPVATSSGESLEKRIGDPGQHAALGEELIWFAVPLLVLSLALVLIEHLTARGRRFPAWLGVTVAGLSIVAALACAVQVYRVGDSGARAAWGDQVSAPATRGPVR